MLLAIDTATRHASVALFDGAGVAAEATWRSDNNHSVEVLPTIARLLEQQTLTPDDLSAVAVAQGPGSFTGLRIGISLAKGLCLSLGIPIIAIPTLEVVAYAAGDPGTAIWAVLEAGRGRICVAAYRFEEGLPVQISDLNVVRSSQWVVDAHEPIMVAGEVSNTLAERLLGQRDAAQIAVPSLAGSIRRAGYLAELAWDRLVDGRADVVDELAPIYAHHPASGSTS